MGNRCCQPEETVTPIDDKRRTSIRKLSEKPKRKSNSQKKVANTGNTSINTTTKVSKLPSPNKRLRTE